MGIDLDFIDAEVQYMAGNKQPLANYIAVYGVPNDQPAKNFIASIVAGKIKRNRKYSSAIRNSKIILMMSYYTRVRDYAKQNNIIYDLRSNEDIRVLVGKLLSIEPGSIKKMYQRRNGKSGTK